ACAAAAGGADAALRYVLHRHLHPPPGARAGGQLADPVDRSQGDDRPADSAISETVEHDDHCYDDLSGSLARSDSGLYYATDLACGVDRRRNRLPDRVVDPR